MRSKKYFYYLISVSFIVGVYIGVNKSASILPGVVESNSPDDEVCISLPKSANSQKLRKTLDGLDFRITYQEFESKKDLESLVRSKSCQIYLFPSEYLGLFGDSSLLHKFSQADIDLTKLSPDFLSLSFDRLNEYFIPIGFWTTKAEDPKIDLHILLASVSAESKNLKLTKEVIKNFLTTDIQSILASESNIFTVLKDTEINISLKSSSIRQFKLKDLTLLKDEQ